MPTQPYVYRIVAVEKVTDGDTYWLRVDVGFRAWVLVDVRLDGWDCPELYHPRSVFEREKALDAKAMADAWLRTPGVTTWIRTEKDPDDFGRWLGDIWYERPDGTDVHLGPSLAGLDLATPWPTRWHEVYDQPIPDPTTE